MKTRLVRSIMVVGAISILLGSLSHIYTILFLKSLEKDYDNVSFEAYVCQDIIDRFTGYQTQDQNRRIYMRCLKYLHTIYGSKLETLQICTL